MFYPLYFLKKLNFGSKKTHMIYKRNLTISNKYFKKNYFYISRGLYPVKYPNNALIITGKYKFGMFSFTRKPFAIPEKKKTRSKKKR